jgi:Uma2 family endonuclease
VSKGGAERRSSPFKEEQMMATVTQKLLTAEEFRLLPEPPDGSQQELIRGVVVTMPPPGGRHGACCVRISSRLFLHVDANRLGTVVSNDTGFVTDRDPDTVRGPDVSFWSKERLPEVPEGYPTVAPDLVVEVVSPGDHFSRLQNKVRHYLTHGVKLVWVVDPEDRSVTVYRSLTQGSILTENDTLTGNDVVPGFSVPVRDILP